MRTILVVIYFIFLLIYSLIMIVLDKLFKFKPDSVYKQFKMIAKHLNFLAGNDFELIGEENIPDEPVLIVSNHESNFDPVVIVRIIDKTTSLVAKKELNKLPTLGYWISKYGSEFIDRDDMKKTIKTISNISRQLENGNNVLIFPEGTRNVVDQEFKAGSFKIAKKAKAGILPITIRNTSSLFEQNKHFQIKKAKPQITIHPVVTYDEYKDTNLTIVAKDVQQIVNATKYMG